MAFLDLPQPVLGLTREHGGETLTCLFNLGADEAVIEMPETRCGAALEGHGFGAPREGDLVRLPAHGAFFASTGGAG